MLVSAGLMNHDGGSRCLRCLFMLVCTLSIIPIGRCAATLHNARGTNGLITVESRPSGFAPTTSHNPMLTARDDPADTVAIKTECLNTTMPRPRVLNAYAMLIPSQAHADLLSLIIHDIREAVIEALEPAIGPMKLTFSVGTIVFHIWLLAAKPGIVTLLNELFDIVLMMASPISLLAVELAFAGSVYMWIQLGGDVGPALLKRRTVHISQFI